MKKLILTLFVLMFNGMNSDSLAEIAISTSPDQTKISFDESSYEEFQKFISTYGAQIYSELTQYGHSHITLEFTKPVTAILLDEVDFERWTLRRKNIKICGNEIQVPILAYAVCKGAIAMLPVSCTVGATTSAGTACALDIGLASAACSISLAVLTRIAQDCINGRT